VSAPNAPARVLLVDDQTLFRAGLARILDEDPRMEVVGQAADGIEALQLVQELRPDIVLMDLKMPRMDGVEATKRLVEDHPGIKVLILATFETDRYVLQALRAGASGYILKDCEAEAIISARTKIVTGAVTMVEMALNELSAKKVVELDDERKASMVNNLMTVLCAESEAQPVINTGTLYH